LTVNGSSLLTGANTITATYAGAVGFSSATASLTVTAGSVDRPEPTP
jgi:hypothetical protein